MYLKINLSIGFLLLLNTKSILSQNADFTTLNVQILDEKNHSTAARVRFTDLNNHYYAPEGSLADFPVTNTTDPHSQEDGLILDDDRRFTYATGFFSIKFIVFNRSP